MVTDLVTSFRARSFVRGDIRISNLLVRMDLKAVERLRLATGREGDVPYPVLINNRTVRRPPNMVSGQLIATEHNRMMTYCTHSMRNDVVADRDADVRLSRGHYRIFQRKIYP